MQQWTSKKAYEALLPQLNEKQRRLYGASEALRLGYGGISKVKEETGISRVTITKGIEELESGIIPNSRIRKIGGGRKKITETDATLLVDLDKLIDDTKGNPMNFVKWTTKSIVHVRQGLEKMGHSIKDTAVFKLLKGQHYSLRGNKKDDEGKSHEDRDAQFQHINKQCEEFGRWYFK